MGWSTVRFRKSALLPALSSCLWSASTAVNGGLATRMLVRSGAKKEPHVPPRSHRIALASLQASDRARPATPLPASHKGQEDYLHVGRSESRVWVTARKARHHDVNPKSKTYEKVVQRSRCHGKRGESASHGVTTTIDLNLGRASTTAASMGSTRANRRVRDDQDADNFTSKTGTSDLTVLCATRTMLVAGLSNNRDNGGLPASPSTTKGRRTRRHDIPTRRSTASRRGYG